MNKDLRSSLLYLMTAIIVVVCMFYSTTVYRDIADTFIDSRKAFTSQLHGIIKDERNVFASITEEQRTNLITNLSIPELESTDIKVVRDLGLYSMYLFFSGYIVLLFGHSIRIFIRYNKANAVDAKKQRD